MILIEMQQSGDDVMMERHRYGGRRRIDGATHRDPDRPSMFMAVRRGLRPSIRTSQPLTMIPKDTECRSMRTMRVRRSACWMRWKP